MNTPNRDKQNPMTQNHELNYKQNLELNYEQNHELDQEAAESASARHLEEALASFRTSIRQWSQHELSHRPAVVLSQPSRATWHWLTAPALTWAAAAALAIGAVGIPLGIHHHHAVLAGQQAAKARQQQREQQAAQLASTRADDDHLLEHVDTDIAQDTPDAMQPLASLMSSSQ